MQLRLVQGGWFRGLVCNTGVTSFGTHTYMIEMQERRSLLSYLAALLRRWSPCTAGCVCSAQILAAFDSANTIIEWGEIHC